MTEGGCRWREWCQGKGKQPKGRMRHLTSPAQLGSPSPWLRDSSVLRFLASALGSSCCIYTEWKIKVFRILFILVESDILRSHCTDMIMMFTFQLQFSLAVLNSEFSGRIGKMSTMNSLFMSQCASWWISLLVKGPSIRQDSIVPKLYGISQPMPLSTLYN